MIKRIIFNRVEKWVNELGPEHKTPEFIHAALGLLRVIGVPTNFSNLITKKSRKETKRVEIWTGRMTVASARQRAHGNRRTALENLGRLLR